jgi:hypothetical protein
MGRCCLTGDWFTLRHEGEGRGREPEDGAAGRNVGNGILRYEGNWHCCIRSWVDFAACGVPKAASAVSA